MLCPVAPMEYVANLSFQCHSDNALVCIHNAIVSIYQFFVNCFLFCFCNDITVLSNTVGTVPVYNIDDINFYNLNNMIVLYHMAVSKKS